MSLSALFLVLSVCLLGAMSPGPSLALVLQYTLQNGRPSGLRVAMGHSMGIGLYASATVFGIATILTRSDFLFSLVQWGGALFLFYLGLQALLTKADTHMEMIEEPHNKAMRDGFLMACLNPYTAIFFIALLSQVIDAQTILIAKLIYIVGAILIDMGWYAAVAWFFSQPRWLAVLQRYSAWLNRTLGVILLSFAIRLVLSA